jgi:hypothetical protein
LRRRLNPRAGRVEEDVVSCLRTTPGRLVAAGAAWLLLASGCAAARGGSVASDGASDGQEYFARPQPRDPWSFQIRRWQARVAAQIRLEGEGRTNPDASLRPTLALRYALFRREQRRALARGVSLWAQEEGQRSFVADLGADHWPTLSEVLDRGGDDCDGLELLTYYALRGLGFAPGELYRAIVMRTRDRQHHMVTLWFENPNDPWVIDPTGAMVRGMPQLSRVEGWVVLKLFSETEEFTPHSRSGSTVQLERP